MEDMSYVAIGNQFYSIILFLIGYFLLFGCNVTFEREITPEQWKWEGVRVLSNVIYGVTSSMGIMELSQKQNDYWVGWIVPLLTSLIFIFVIKKKNCMVWTINGITCMAVSLITILQTYREPFYFYMYYFIVLVLSFIAYIILLVRRKRHPQDSY